METKKNYNYFLKFVLPFNTIHIKIHLKTKNAKNNFFLHFFFLITIIVNFSILLIKMYIFQF